MAVNEQRIQQRVLLGIVALIAVGCLTHHCWTVDPVWTSRAVSVVIVALVLFGVGMRIRSSRQVSLLEITLLVPLIAALVIHPAQLVVKNQVLRNLLDKSNVQYELVTDGYVSSKMSRLATLLTGSNYQPVSTMFATKLYSLWFNADQLDDSIFDLRLADAKHVTVFFTSEKALDDNILEWLSQCSADCNLKLSFHDMQTGQINGDLGLVSAKIFFARSTLGMSDLRAVLQGEHQCLVLYDVAMQNEVDYSALPKRSMEALAVQCANSKQFQASDLVGLVKLLEPKFVQVDIELGLDSCLELSKTARLQVFESHVSTISFEEVEAICSCRSLKKLTVNGGGLSWQEQQDIQAAHPDIECIFYETR